MKQSFLRFLSILKKIFSIRNIIILILLVIIFFMLFDSRKLNSFSSNSRYELKNKDDYSFYLDCRYKFREFHNEKYNFLDLIKLIENEINLRTYVYFPLSKMFSNYTKRGRERVIINNYYSNDLIKQKTFYSLSDNMKESREELFTKLVIDPVNLNYINDQMRLVGIDVINKLPDSIELCWDSPVGDMNLDEYSGYLYCYIPVDEEAIKMRYIYLSKIDDNWYFFQKKIKK